MPLYPLKFFPRFVPKIWGGRRLSSALGKVLADNSLIGESWELYDFPPGVVEKSAEWLSSVVANGALAGRTLRSLVGEYRDRLLGGAKLVGEHGQFPLLIKYLDARDDLSVQVHPDLAYATLNVNCHLKTEAWYVVERESGAAIYKGMTPGTTRESFEAAIASGTVMDRIVRVPVEAGDCHYLPSGTVHALGAGVLVAEVQTPSDTTFRVYDFERVEEGTGKPRALHVEQALECIDFAGSVAEGDRKAEVDGLTTLVSSPFFTMKRVRAGAERFVGGGEMSILMMLGGKAAVAGTGVARGETVLMPAGMERSRVEASADAVWLEVGVPTRDP